ncbi:MAG: hypothetical protein A3J24_04795 [Deltaproteobacteria bacterium RIFCSPLOWO2_02_FULL_53_8]|nr:MAG: hypothetical protein A3J24_04795 [Deltaproteobacteria bacterium RIFCSPLOWO2_02_FULL_53_8]
MNILKKRSVIELLLILPLIALAGCSGVVTQPEGTRIEKSQALEIKPGETTRESLISTFGQPAESKTEGVYERLVFVFKEHKTPTYFGGLVESELNAKDKTTTLEVIIKEGLVEEYRYKVVEK